MNPPWLIAFGILGVVCLWTAFAEWINSAPWSYVLPYTVAGVALIAAVVLDAVGVIA